MNKHLMTLIAASVFALTACAPAGKATESNPSQANSAASTGHSNNETPVDGNSSAATPNLLPVLPAEPFPVDARTYSSPWKRSDTQILIDAYEGNAIDWNKMATDKRVSAVIHRASSGGTVDALYKSREKIARSRGYLWGAYHLGKSGDPIQQAKLFLQTVGTDKDTLMFLDLEDTSAAGMMNIAGAKKFLSYVYAQTGRMPVVYANGSVALAITAAMKLDTTFAKTRLWYARFKSSITDFHAGALLWPSYFLWQFSSEINCTHTGSCLYNVPGTSFDMDVNVFYGGEAALKYEWSL